MWQPIGRSELPLPTAATGRDSPGIVVSWRWALPRGRRSDGCSGFGSSVVQIALLAIRSRTCLSSVSMKRVRLNSDLAGQYSYSPLADGLVACCSFTDDGSCKWFVARGIPTVQKVCHLDGGYRIGIYDSHCDSKCRRSLGARHNGLLHAGACGCETSQKSTTNRIGEFQ